ncbi:hypothetical protein BDV97DRAFT_378999 [Delphinella strobiligena]|nr:hypothetical protein BDV97DRAFT_378999 [Delphinella strobiligena]
MLGRVKRPGYVCAQCLTRSRRGYATSSSGTGLPPAPPPSGASKLTNRRLISLHGKDTPKFLQGIITNNVRPQSHTGFFAAFLTAQGKVLNDVFVYPTLGSQWHTGVNKTEEPGYLVEVDAEQATTLLAHLKRHKLRSNFQLRLLDQGELNVWSTWKEQDKWTPHASAFPEAAEQNGGEERHGDISLVDTRAPGMGRRVLLSDSSPLSSHPILSSLEEAPFEAYTIRRYLRGIPEGQAEIPRDGAFPMNANIDLMDGIDFKKGCYVGQELTIRTHHTGVVRRRILPVTLYDTASTPPEKAHYDPSTSLSLPTQDADIKAVGKRGKPGKWIAGLGNVGIAMCRVEMMTDLVVTGEPSSYSTDDRFVIMAGTEGSREEIGVKAFVPDWIRGKVRPPKVLRRVA